MRGKVYIFIMSVTLGLGILLFCGCTEDSGSEMHSEGTRLHLFVFPQSFQDLTPLQTRALPDGYVTYESLNPHVDMNHIQIQAYMTGCKDADNKNDDVIISSIFTFQEDDEGEEKKYSWNSTTPTIRPGNYYLYGFMPAEDADHVSIAPYKKSTESEADYKDGATLTISGLNALTPSDVCVIVGVKGTTDDTKSIENVDIRLGDFGFQCAADQKESFVYLLLEHLYAGLHFKFSVDPEYDKLRTIKLKSMKLKAEKENQTSVATVKATIHVKALPNGDNTTSPLEGVEWEAETYSNASEPAALYQGNEKILTTTPEEFLACFAPHTNSEFELETIYNVYDKKGNLIREDCSTKNRIHVSVDDMQSGKIHTVNIVVVPTYLYVLSEQDLDNPTIIVGS